MQSFKQERTAQILSQEINTMIIMGKIKDPRVSNRVSVLYVKVSKDFTSAVIYVSSFLEDKALEKTVSALNHAKGYIQREIAKKHKWRNTPKLVFKMSNGLKHEERIQQVLNMKHVDNSVADDSDEIDEDSIQD